MTKEVSVNWFIDKDGTRLADIDLQYFLEQHGTELDPSYYQIVDWTKIRDLENAALRRGETYITGQKYEGFSKGAIQLNGYISTGYAFAHDSGLYDLAMIAGLSYAGAKAKPGNKVPNAKKVGGNKTVNQPSDFATEIFLPEEYYKNNYSSMDGAPNSRMDFNRLGSSGNVEKSVVIYDNRGKQIIRVDYSDHANPFHHTDSHIHEFDWFDGGRAANETKYFLDDKGRLRAGVIDKNTNSIKFLD